MNLHHRVYRGTDGYIAVLLTDGGAPLANGITLLNRAVLRLTPEAGGADVVVDSDTAPGVFDWVTEGASSILRIVLGQVGSIVPGRWRARLDTIDPQARIAWRDPRDPAIWTIDVVDDPGLQ